MNGKSAFVHAIDGRMRIKIGKIKGSCRGAVQIERLLRRCEGVESVRANPTTGSVVIEYNRRQTNQGQIVEVLCDDGWLEREHLLNPPGASATTSAALPRVVARQVVNVAVESALKGLVAAMI